MKKYTEAALCLMMFLAAVGCAAKSDGSETVGTEKAEYAAYEINTSVNMDKLKENYPEFFESEEISENIGVYVWQMSENSYSCGLMYGTDTDKTEEEIWSLQKKAPLTVDEAKALLNEMGAAKDLIRVYPVVQPYSSYYYELNDEYCEKVQALFDIDA